jgi:hypothetical protein
MIRRGGSSSSYIFDGGPTVVDGNWELEFWTKAVVNVDDLDANIVANAATPRLLGWETTKDPTSAVHVEVHRHASFLFWGVHSHIDMSSRIEDRNCDILGFMYFRTLGQVVNKREKV